MRSRAELLSLLKPELGESEIRAAAALLDPVANFLATKGATGLFDNPPELIFDPVAASSFIPDPIELPGTGKAANSSQSELEWQDPQDIARLVSTREASWNEIADAFGDRISRWQPELNAFVTTTLDRGTPPKSTDGALVGVPIGVHDMIATAGVRTTAGSRILADYVPSDSAVSWKRLEDAGALLAGKLSTQEFAAGTTGDNDWFGPVLNPWDTTRGAGGAAGGAGAALAAGLISAAIATDPGGSIRVPAALCGVVALKPTFGAIDRRGTIPLTWSTETLGVLARTVRGAAAISDLLLDGRARDRWGISCEQAAARGADGRLAIRVGVPTGWLEMGLDPDVENAFHQALNVLVELGAVLVEVAPPSIDDIAPTHRAIAFSEASSIHEQIIQTRASEYGEAIRARQEAGRGVLASEYLKAARLRGQFTRAFSELWHEVDVFAIPTSPVPAAPVGVTQLVTGPRGTEAAHSVYTRYSAPMSTLGLPAISIPCGFNRDGLPIGIQLSAPPHAEPLLFHVASAYQTSTSWHRSHPALVTSMEPA